ncbi:DUF4380 domain-containing protein [Nocardia carnea]|uniref:DUF4380 domain-containing protein n=1 Tax=Nocardia carnea TaxID=37328 RepID=UPI002458C897|nr:DUF4380 domain-containing protein [Nocardia carnea]
MTPRLPSTGILVESDEGDGLRPGTVWLDNGVLRLGFVPALGGRLLSVQLRGRETLWRNTELLDDDLHPVAPHVPAPVSGPMSVWNNYGGDKTWPAPQGWSGPAEWAGPPDPVLDSGPYDRRVERTAGAVTLTMTSGHDPRTGLTLTRAVTLRYGQSWYDVRLEARNTSAERVRWALWNVTQRAAGEPGTGGVYIGIGDGDRRTVPLAVGTGAPRHEILGDDRVLVPHQDIVGKVGFPGASGWLAHAAHGLTTTQTFAVDPGGDYPDGGSRVEVWMEHPLSEPIESLGGLQPRARIVEIELLGPSVTLAPGEHTALEYRCATAAGEGEVRTVTPVGHWGSDARFAAYVGGDLEASGITVAGVRAGEVTALDSDLIGSPITLREHGTGVEHDLGTASGRGRAHDQEEQL